MTDTASGGAVPALDVTDLTVRFAGLTALDSVSFTVQPGSVHALIGPNGAGKSTSFNVLSGVYRATSGSVRFGEAELTKLPPDRIAALGIARTFQNLALPPHATVADSLLLGRHRLTRAGFLAAGLRLPSAAREARQHLERVREIAEFTGLGGDLDRLAGALPYGKQKLVELGRALCMEPRLLLLDEPVAGMTADERRQIASVIAGVRDSLGISIVLVEHDMGMVMRLADAVTVLDFGRPDRRRHPRTGTERPGRRTGLSRNGGPGMTTFTELLLGGLSIGAVYALIALGFVVIFKATEVVNFAHASLLLAGGYVTAVLHDDIGFWGALAVGIAGAALVGAAVEFLVMRRYRGSDHSVLAIVTIGVDILLTTELTRRIGTDVLALGDPWGDRVVTIGDITIAQTRIAAFVSAALLITAFLLAFRYTSWGVSMRAAAENPETAALMGVRQGRVSLAAWAVAGALAAVAALFLTVFPTPGLERATSLAALKAFPAAILGGLDSTTGALAGGLIVGVTESFATGYQSELSFLGRGIGDLAPYLVMVLVLLLRPAGLFGTKEPARV